MSTQAAKRPSRSSKNRATPSTRSPMRDLLAAGDYRAARRVALQVLAQEDVEPSLREEAERVVQATQIPRPALAVGVIGGAVVVLLFVFAALQVV